MVLDPVISAAASYFFPHPHSVSELRANEQDDWNVCFWIHAHISPVYSPGGEPYGALADTTHPRLILDSTSPARSRGQYRPLELVRMQM